MMQYKTEKRPAKVGEKILITNAPHSKPLSTRKYRNGDIFTVKQVHGGWVPWVSVYEHDDAIFNRVYEVIIENGGEEMSGIIEKMQAEIDELKAKVGALEDATKPKTTEFNTKVMVQMKTPKARRDEIVAQAKADVEELLSTSRVDSVPNLAGYLESFYPKGHGDLDQVDFVVNSGKGTVVALISYIRESKVWAKGIAKCAPDDCFNSHIGRAIALRRALGLEVPSEYLNVPQPTEVRVGDVVRFKKYGTNTYFQNTVASIDNDYLKLKLVEGGRTNFDARTDKIIDDSREDD